MKQSFIVDLELSQTEPVESTVYSSIDPVLSTVSPSYTVVTPVHVG